jgi:glutathione S-transferase
MTTPSTPSTPSIVVHHLEHSRSHRILWLLEELELPYQLKVYQRDKAGRAPTTLRTVHPLGRAPVLELDGQVIAESGAIIETVVERFGSNSGLRPEQPSPAFVHWRYFMHYAEGSLMPPLLVGLITGRLRTTPLPFFVKPIVKGVADQIDAAYTRGEIDNHAAFLEGHLASRAYFCGDAFTAADIQMVYGVEALVKSGGIPVPRCAAWLKRVNERPAAVRALAKGGPMMPPSST